MIKEELIHWFKASFVGIFICAVFAFYLYLPTKRLDLFYLNKSFASTAATLAAITLLIGPLVHVWKFMTGWMMIRRHVGLTAFGFALVHVVISLFFLPDRFPLKWYQQEIIPIIGGIIAFSIWVYLVKISTNASIVKLGVEVWKKHQKIGGWIAFLFVFFHITIIRWDFWLRWLKGDLGKTIPAFKNPYYVPADFVLVLIMVGVVLYRIALFFYLKHKNSISGK